jgi:hypothetical protein
MHLQYQKVQSMYLNQSMCLKWAQWAQEQAQEQAQAQAQAQAQMLLHYSGLP